MKAIRIFLKKGMYIILLIMLSLPIAAQENSPSMDAWSKLLNKPNLAEYFTDIFSSMGIIVDETNESFTVYHKGDHFTSEKGIKKEGVDYLVHLKPQDIENMASYGEDGTISSMENYKILSFLFTPLTTATLQAPMMSKPCMMKMAGIENLIHVYLVSPDQKEINSHTLIFINKHWLVIEGIHGIPERTFKMTPDQALEYQKHVFRAMKANNTKEWKKLKKWYLTWRKEVSVV